MTRLSQLAKVFSGKSFEEQRPVQIVIYRPLVELAATIGRFEPPFEFLRTESICFDPFQRFLLDHALRGDADAILAREAYVNRERRDTLGESVSRPDRQDWERFAESHKEEFQAYCRMSRNAFEHKRHPELDKFMTEAVIDHLGSFGFRRLGKSFRCDALGQPLFIKWNKGTWRMHIYFYLAIPAYRIQQELCYPFLFSSGYFPEHRTAPVRERLQRFFEVYGRVFPQILQAYRTGIMQAEHLLESSCAV